MHDQMIEEEIDGVLQPTSIVSGEDEMEAFDLLFLAVNLLGLSILKLGIYDMLRLELLQDFSSEFRGTQVLAELGRAGKREVVRFGNHALFWLAGNFNRSSVVTYQELINCQRHLILRARDSDYITRFLSAGKGDLAIELLLELVDLIQACN